MSYEEFIQNFDQVEMCHFEPDLVGTNLAADVVMSFGFQKEEKEKQISNKQQQQATVAIKEHAVAPV